MERRTVQCPLKGIHNYYALHRLCVQIDVLSSGSFFVKHSVCLYKFGLVFFLPNVFYNILKIQTLESSYFSRYLLVSENKAISRYYDSLIVPICLVCSCATHIIKTLKFHVFCADLFRRYSQLPAKTKFGQKNCNHTKNISKTQKQ